MIERLTGTVAAKHPDSVVLDVGGVGFQLEVSATTMRDVPAVGGAMVMFAHLHVREDALQLFGFSSEAERQLFRLFLGVSKIGPKLALAALSCRRPTDLRKALAGGDVALLSSVPGIGRKTAERMVMELRDKVGEFVSAAGDIVGMSGSDDGPVALARAALLELGYAPQEADRLLAEADTDQPVEGIIRQALGRCP
jgi:Holliday junction DNA helicase RuvA